MDDIEFLHGKIKEIEVQIKADIARTYDLCMNTLQEGISLDEGKVNYLSLLDCGSRNMQTRSFYYRSVIPATKENRAIFENYGEEPPVPYWPVSIGNKEDYISGRLSFPSKESPFLMNPDAYQSPLHRRLAEKYNAYIIAHHTRIVPLRRARLKLETALRLKEHERLSRILNGEPTPPSTDSPGIKEQGSGIEGTTGLMPGEKTKFARSCVEKFESSPTNDQGTFYSFCENEYRMLKEDHSNRIERDNWTFEKFYDLTKKEKSKRYNERMHTKKRE